MQNLKSSFAIHLQNKLRQRYGKLPSCAVFARDFSLLARDVEPISIETARKWMRGKALPHAARLRVLCAWLQIDPSLGHIESEQHDKQLFNTHNLNGTHHPNPELLRLVEKLSSAEVEILVELLKIYIKKKNK